jgi:hypothetical protein
MTTVIDVANFILLLSKMDVIKQSETTRDEDKEWRRIRELQREKAARMFGGGSN